MTNNTKQARFLKPGDIITDGVLSKVRWVNRYDDDISIGVEDVNGYRYMISRRPSADMRIYTTAQYNALRYAA